MENINEFIEQAKEEIMMHLPENVAKEITIENNRVVKINDQIMYGLTMRRNNEEKAPAIYMNDLFERYNGGESLKVLMEEAAQEYLGVISIPAPEITTKDLSFECIKDDLTLKLVEIKRNHEYLSEVPYLKVGNGFAIVCDIKLADGNGGQLRTSVTRGLMEEMDYDKTELFSYAIENSQVKDPAVMNSVMSQLLFGDEHNLLNDTGVISGEEMDTMYVVSNRECLYGASVLYYPGVQERISEKFGENYYVIPSSVNEFLVIPESKAPEVKDIASMVYETNHKILEPKEVLSDNIFYYDKETKRLETIQSEFARGIKSPEPELRS